MIKGLPELLEPSQLAAQLPHQNSHHPQYHQYPAGMSASPATIPITPGPGATTTSATMSTGVRGSLLAVPGSTEKGTSLIQARFGRPRFSRTQSLYQDISGAAAGEGPGTWTETGGRSSRLESLAEEEHGGSAEAKSSDHPTLYIAHPSSVDRTSAESHAAAPSPLPQVPVKYLRKPQRSPLPGGEGRKFAPLGRSLPSSDSVGDRMVAEIDDVASFCNDDYDGEDAAVLVCSTTHAAAAQADYLYFPLELTQRDYLRKLFEVLGDSLRGPLIALFQVTEHLSASAVTAATQAAASAVHAGSGGAGGGLFGSSTSTPTFHNAHLRHSTGGGAAGAGAGVTSGQPGAEGSAASNAFPLSAALRYDAVSLLQLLLDSRYNFKLRPFVCAAGGNIPSNDAYADVLRNCEALLAAHSEQVCALVEEPGRSGLMSKPESGQLCDISFIFDLARSLLSSVHQASLKAAKRHNSPSALQRDLNQLQELQTQMEDHRQLKEQRMAARGWQWEGSTTPKSSSQANLRQISAKNGPTKIAGGSELLSPIPVIVGRRSSAFFSPDSPVLDGSPRTPGANAGGAAGGAGAGSTAATGHTSDDKYHGDSGSSAFVRKVNSPGGNQLDNTHNNSNHSRALAVHCSRRSSVSSSSSATPPLVFTGLNINTGLSFGTHPHNSNHHPSSMHVLQDKETILLHLFRRSEATVAHLMVGVLPSNIAVIELMVSFSEIHEVLKVYQEHHRKSGHREEAQFLRGFAEALQQQLEMDLSSIGAFKTSQQVADKATAAAARGVAIAETITATPAGILSPGTASAKKGDKKGELGPNPSNPLSSPSSANLLTLTQGPTIADSGRKVSGRKGGAAVSTEMLDQIYMELDDMAAALAEAKSTASSTSSENGGGGGGGGGDSRPSVSLKTPVGGLNKSNKPSGASLPGAVSIGPAPTSAKLSKASKEALIAAKREAWSYLTAPVDVDTSTATDMSGKLGMAGNSTSTTAAAHSQAVRIHHRVQSGRYLLEHMGSLVSTSDELITQLEDCRIALVAQRNREYADVDHELTPEQLRMFIVQEERIAAAVKELTTLSTQIKHKLAPLHLTHNEELISLLSTRGMMGDLANKLFSMSLTTVNAGHREHIAVCVATLLIRSKSTALVHSVYHNWPSLSITVAVITTESVDGSVLDTTAQQNRSSLDMNGSIATKATTPGPNNRSFAPGYKQPYTLDFTSSVLLASPRGKTVSANDNSLLSPSRHASGGVGGRTPYSAGGGGGAGGLQQQPQQVTHVQYVTQPACEIDVFASLDFSSSRSLRLMGFTLHQLRDSKGFDLKELLSAGYPLNEVKNLKSTLYVNITAKDLRLAGYTAHEVRFN